MGLISARLPLPTMSFGAARGVWLTDSSGRRYLDASSGLINCNIGHGSDRVASAMQHSASTGAFTASGVMLSEDQHAYADELLRTIGRPDDIVNFRSTGSEALEGAISLAKAIHRDRRADARRRVLTLRVSYHGNTMLLLALSGLRRRRTPDLDDLHIAPTLDGFDTRWSDPFSGLEEQLAQPDVAAVIVEPVNGTSGGAVPPPDGFLPLLRQLCTEYGVILIHDEILTGLGRAGAPLAADLWPGSEADFTVLAKGLGAGYYPISAIVIRRDLAEPIEAKRMPTPLMGTMSTSPMQASVGRAVLRETVESDYWHDKAAHADRLETGLRDAIAGSSRFRDLRGRGYLWAFELPDGEQAEAFGEFRDAGLICYPFNGFRPDATGEGFIVAPPLTASPAEIDQIVQAIREVS